MKRICMFLMIFVLPLVVLCGCESNKLELKKIKINSVIDQYEEVWDDRNCSPLMKINIYCPNESKKTYFTTDNTMRESNSPMIYFRDIRTGQKIITTCHYFIESVTQKRTPPETVENDFLGNLLSREEKTEITSNSQKSEVIQKKTPTVENERIIIHNNIQNN